MELSAQHSNAAGSFTAEQDGLARCTTAGASVTCVLKSFA
jgi:hypothetical protein